jgi:hypothetical protein
MVKSFWSLFYLSLIGGLLFLILLVLELLFIKKLFLEKPHGWIKFAAVTAVILFFVALSGISFIQCCRDYHYVAGGTFEEENAKVIEFTYTKMDSDGNGQMTNTKPKFLLVDRNEYIVLYAKEVELGKTYLIRYYPNTKICEVIQEIQ